MSEVTMDRMTADAMTGDAMTGDAMTGDAMTGGAMTGGAMTGGAMTGHAAAPARALVYNDNIVRKFTIATMFWAAVAMLVGVVLALQLCWPAFNLGFSFTTFGKYKLPRHFLKRLAF